MVFYAPNYMGHSDNYIPANPMQTPPSIVPEWYLLPFYAILRSIPNKLLLTLNSISAYDLNMSLYAGKSNKILLKLKLQLNIYYHID